MIQFLLLYIIPCSRTTVNSVKKNPFLKTLYFHRWEKSGEKCTGFWQESPNERAHSEDRGADGRMGSEWIFRRLAGGVWSGFSWLRIGTNGGLL
jgi:hypothetical protein